MAGADHGQEVQEAKEGYSAQPSGRSAFFLSFFHAQGMLCR